MGFELARYGSYDYLIKTDGTTIWCIDKNERVVKSGTVAATVIQYALDQLDAAKGGIIYGDIKTQLTITTPILIQKNNVTFKNFNLKLGSAVNDAIIKVGDGGTTAFSHIRLYDLRLDGNKDNNTTGYGIYFNKKITYGIIDNCFIEKCDNNAIHLESTAIADGNHYTHISNCSTYLNNGYGIYIETASNDTMISNCIFNTDGNGIFAEYTDWTKIINCTILDVWEFGCRIGNRCQVTNCNFEYCNGVYIRNDGNTVNGNVFWGGAAAKTDGRLYAIRTASNADYNTICNNVVYGDATSNHNTGFMLACSMSTICNNAIEYCRVDGINMNASCYNNTVNGNVVKYCTNDGVALNGAGSNTVVGNRVSVCDTGIKEIGGADYNNIGLNVARQNTTAGIVTVGGNTVTSNNIV